MNFVIVDNNKSDLDLLAEIMSASKPECQVQLFTDPLLSAKYICNNDVDMAFLAAEMSPVDGFILMRTLRTNKPTLPIVILSNNKSSRIDAIHAGANGHLLKPFSADRLKELVNKFAV